MRLSPFGRLVDSVVAIWEICAPAMASAQAVHLSLTANPRRPQAPHTPITSTAYRRDESPHTPTDSLWRVAPRIGG